MSGRPWTARKRSSRGGNGSWKNPFRALPGSFASDSRKTREENSNGQQQEQQEQQIFADSAALLVLGTRKIRKTPGTENCLQPRRRKKEQEKKKKKPTKTKTINQTDLRIVPQEGTSPESPWVATERVAGVAMLHAGLRLCLFCFVLFRFRDNHTNVSQKKQPNTVKERK
mmetsp:Transcript_27003/g.55874  ORF Transcript_27003/g.55874 Transcript_27003/m.55874 type:complete len:170 (-) Transcript_27003:2082-2591(-)